MQKILLRQKYRISLFVLLSLIVGLIDISFALIIQLFINSIENSKLLIFQISVLLFILFVMLNYFMTYWQIKFQSEIQKRIHIDIKRRLINFCMFADFEYFQETSIGEKINYFEYYMDVYEQYYLNNILELIANIFVLIIGISYLLSVSVVITIVIFVLGIISLIIPIILGKIINTMVDENAELNSKFLSTIKEIMTGMEVIRGYRAEERFITEFNGNLESLEKNTQILSVTNGKLNQISALIQYVMIILCLIITGSGVIVGNLNLGQLVAVTQVSNMLIMPMQQIGMAILDIGGSKSIREKLNNLVNYGDDHNCCLEKCEEKIESIEFRNLSLESKNGHKILDNIDFVFKSRKKYAVVGDNGSGKSTLFQVILGIRKNYSGNVFVNGKDLKGKIITNISFLPQESVIFRKNITENILLGRNELNDRLDGILEKVNISKSFFKQMLTKGEYSMSGGEKRKINIARTFIGNSSVILMDEFENTLDKETKGMVQDYILEQQDKMVICITHSLDKDFLNGMDEIIYLKDGKVIDEDEYMQRTIDEGEKK
ncbi:ABC transporter ATP-binding protein [Ligilactobacillus murinus]|uniref:ABC transporter transmembrane domain-containing protein n=1 Tax=Ligilactobacillus murinus TaxID=1622 RepID=UPI00138F295F|nr:ABC transporter ATP-binding protein [Ligilactobacillus murinus]NDO26746.1 ABC transporter ATP-binding protein [Ligilactobacillus murinus]